MNQIIDKLPDVIQNAYVVNSSGRPAAPGKLHFKAEGYRTLGTRYGTKMLSLLGYKSIYYGACSNNLKHRQVMPLYLVAAA